VRRALPLSGLDALAPVARRTTAVRLVLAAALVAVVVASLLVARSLPVQYSSFFPAGGSGVIVLDFSTSIDIPGFRRVRNVLRPVVESNQPVGVVYFSDVAYEALPPATPGRELRPFLRFLETPPLRSSFTSQEIRERDARFEAKANPWSAAFRGGTRISQGLEVARAAIRRDGIRGETVLLISDLDDSPFDVANLGETIAAYRREGIELRVVPLFPADEDRAYFRQALGPAAFVSHAELLANAHSTQEHSLDGDFPLALLVLGVLLILLLAVNELACGRLDWRAPRPVEAEGPAAVRARRPAWLLAARERAS
jgi:hypothetical protein